MIKFNEALNVVSRGFRCSWRGFAGRSEAAGKGLHIGFSLRCLIMLKYLYYSFNFLDYSLLAKLL